MAITTKRQIFEFIDESGQPYLQHTDFNQSPRNRMKLASIVRMLEDGIGSPDRQRLLEIGCGVGNVAIPLASLGYEVTAIDIHGPSLDAARARNPFSHLKFEQQAAENIDLRVFDAVIVSDVLEHITDCGALLSRIGSGMKPGAKFLLTVPNGWSLTEILCRPSYKIKPHPWGRKAVALIKKILKTHDPTTANESTPHIHFFTLSRLLRLYAQAGMAVESIYSFFCLWTTWETFFSERKAPDSWPRADFNRSQKLPAWLCAEWALMASTGREQP